MNNRKKAKILSWCLDEVRKGALSQQECLSQYPMMDQELKMAFDIQNVFEDNDNLLNIKINSRSAKFSLMQKLPDRKSHVTKIRHPRYKLQNMEWSSTMKWILITSTILSLISTTGVAYASGNALPGETLFPVKLFMEDASLWFASDIKDVEIIEGSLNRRVEELGLMLETESVDDLDKLTGIYQHQYKLLEQSLEKVQAKDPEEAIRLRKELENRLMEQARLMENMMPGETNGENLIHQNSLHQMLEINRETRFRINEENTESEPEIIEAVLEEVAKSDENNEEQGESKNEVENSGKKYNLKFSSQYLQDDQLKFEFQNDSSINENLYAQINGKNFGCTQTEDRLICDFTGSPTSGNINFYNAKTHELIFTYQYQHNYSYLWKVSEESGQESNRQNNHGEYDQEEDGKNGDEKMNGMNKKDKKDK